MELLKLMISFWILGLVVQQLEELFQQSLILSLFWIYFRIGFFALNQFHQWQKVYRAQPF
jgi:hypothetical protein